MQLLHSNNGALPLHIACHNGHLNAAKYLITEQKCDPNSRGGLDEMDTTTLCF